MLKLYDNILEVVLPEGKSQVELLEILKKEFLSIEKDFFGKEIKITGRITTAMSLWLGHKLAHICKSVSIFDPKLYDFILVIQH